MSDRAKQIYRQLRLLPWEKLWNEEVVAFNQATPAQRLDTLAVIRAVAVVFAEKGALRDKEAVQKWLLALLRDPSERIRRYAAAALPKIGADTREEGALLALLKTAGSEKEYVMDALEKIGGAATLQAVRRDNSAVQPQFEQKLKAVAARSLSPSRIRMGKDLESFTGVRLCLRGRQGLEGFVAGEVSDYPATKGKFRVERTASGLVEIVALAPFSLTDVYSWRCFGTAGFALGSVRVSGETESVDVLARLIASPISREILEKFTEGAIRYRLNFVGRGHQRAAIRHLAGRVYELCPEILNDARSVTWTMDIYQSDGASSVELRPNVTPDPRFFYRKSDVPAATHPPLAACMARLAEPADRDVIWDPFCGSALELIECSLLHKPLRILGSDLNAAAIDAAARNFAAAKLGDLRADFIRGDFRDIGGGQALGPESATLIITNPPMGIRVPVADRRGLINDLFAVAAKVLRPGGGLVFANPLHTGCPCPQLKLQTRREVDMGGFACRLERYIKRKS